MTEHRDLRYGTSGPLNAKVMVVGESWGSEEHRQKVPLVGQSGQEWDRMCSEAGISRSDCFLTNVVSAQPPGNDLSEWFLDNDKSLPKWRGLHPQPFVQSEVQRLYSQIAAVGPEVIIAAGNYALWALTGDASITSKSRGGGKTVLVPGGITSWRGSMLVSDDPMLPPHLRGQKVLPIIHPAAILRAWYQRTVTVHDLKARIPQALSDDWRPDDPPMILIAETLENVLSTIDYWLSQADVAPLRLSSDIETSKGFITCLGFGDGPFSSRGTALVIQLIRLDSSGSFTSRWSPSDEAHIMRAVRTLFSHPSILIEGQNYLYDTQYFQRWFGVTPRCDFDTMLAHHLLFPGTPKGLDYLSSLYCHYHRYWKDDGKDWDLKGNERKQLLYNGEDCLRTWECAAELRRLISNFGFEDLWENEKRKYDFALRLMNRGFRVDPLARSRAAFELLAIQQNIHSRLETIIPESLKPAVKSDKKWFESEYQQKPLFYDILGFPPQRNRKTGRPSVDDEAINALSAQFPEWRTLFELMKAERSVGVYHSTFLSSKTDIDGRMRCSFNPAGPETFRWSSSKNAFGSGMNLQNIPMGDED
jgi:uracil-DNA glycosylase